MAKKILIVDDDPDAIHILKVVLERGGYRVITARDGHQALQKMNDEEPALILLDIMLPKKSGFEICKIIKADPKRCGIPVLMLTGEASLPSLRQAVQLGANDYLVKPIDPASLIRKVEEYLAEVHNKLMLDANKPT